MRVALFLLLSLAVSHGCFRLDVSTVAEVLDAASADESGVDLFCDSFGGTEACLSLCDSLHLDACWNLYLHDLTADARFSDSITAWLILQFALDSCATLLPAASPCDEWAKLAPLDTRHRLNQLCSPACDWDDLPRAAVLWVNASHPAAPTRDALCARRADNTFCAVASATSAHSSPCDLIRNGCAAYHLEQLAGELGASEGAAQYELLEAACRLELPATEHAHISLEPPSAAVTPIGRASRAEILSLIASALDADGNGTIGGGAGASTDGGAFFSRLEYNVTVDGSRYTASGLVAEPVAAAPARGLALFFHGSKAPGDPAISAISHLAAASPPPAPSHVVVRLESLRATSLANTDLGLPSNATADPDPYVIISAGGLELARTATVWNTLGRPGGVSRNANAHRAAHWRGPLLASVPMGSAVVGGGGSSVTLHVSLYDRDMAGEGGSSSDRSMDDFMGSASFSVDLTYAGPQAVSLALDGVPVDGSNGALPQPSTLSLVATVEQPLPAPVTCASAASCERFGLDLTAQAEHVLVATLTQLGYIVLCPDDLGLGTSAPPLANQGYLMRDIVSAVSLEMLRAAQQHLLATPGRFRSDRPPELWIMGGSHGGFITAAVQRRLQLEAHLWRFATTGSFMHAAPIDVSGAMLELFTANQSYSNPWYLVMVGKALQVYLPGRTPDFEPYVRAPFLAPYLSPGGWSSEELNQLFLTHGQSIPLDAFNATYQATMRDLTSDVRAAWARTFGSYSDLHEGWQPRAPVQHLGTGALDEQVPPRISVNAGREWNVTVLLVDGAGHTDGIASCLLLAVRNITSAARMPSVVPSSHHLEIEVAPSSLATPFFEWRRIDTAMYCLFAVVGFWLLAGCVLFMRSRHCQRRVSAFSDRIAAQGVEPLKLVRSLSENRMVKALESAGRRIRTLLPHSPHSPSKRKQGEVHEVPLQLAHLGKRSSVSTEPGAPVALVEDAVTMALETTGLRELVASRLINSLLGCPFLIGLGVLLAFLLPTVLQLRSVVSDVVAGEEIFALDISSLRSVTGTLTNRQDAYTVLSGIGAPSMLTIQASPPPTPPPSAPPLAALPSAARRRLGLAHPHANEVGNQHANEGGNRRRLGLARGREATSTEQGLLAALDHAAPSLPNRGHPTSRWLQDGELEAQNELTADVPLTEGTADAGGALEEGVALTRTINIYYTLKGGRRYNPDGVEGNVITPEMMRRIRDAEQRALDRVGGSLRAWRSVVPCFHGQIEPFPPEPLGVLPQTDPTADTIAECLAHISTTSGATLDQYRELFASDFDSSSIGGDDQCSGLRTQLDLSMDTDFDALIRDFLHLSGGGIEVTFGGDTWMTFRELYLALMDDVLWVTLSICAIHAFLVIVLRMPLYGTFALFVIVLCFPVTIAVYLGLLNQQELPILSIVSLYLVLGIGADSVFIFTNTYSLNEVESQKRKQLDGLPGAEPASPARGALDTMLRRWAPSLIRTD